MQFAVDSNGKIIGVGRDGQPEFAAKVFQTLKAMGTNTKDIADFLRAQGIKGHPTHSSLCPLSTYMANVFGEHVDVACGIAWFPARKIDVLLPIAHDVFTQYVDDGHFPDLLTHPPGTQCDHCAKQ